MGLLPEQTWGVWTGKRAQLTSLLALPRLGVCVCLCVCISLPTLKLLETNLQGFEKGQIRSKEITFSDPVPPPTHTDTRTHTHEHTHRHTVHLSRPDTQASQQQSRTPPLPQTCLSRLLCQLPGQVTQAPGCWERDINQATHSAKHPSYPAPTTPRAHPYSHRPI